jgi:hypothetical protein
MPRDGGLRIDDIDHGVNALVKNQGPVPIVGGRRFLLRDQNIGCMIVKGEITGAARHQNIADEYTFVNPRQIFAFDMDLVGVEIDPERNRIFQRLQHFLDGQWHDLFPSWGQSAWRARSSAEHII